jgi:hypothetical protein
MSMPVCRFQFDNGPIWDGFAHGSTWNGFDNVAVTKETLDAIASWADAEAMSPEGNGDCFRSIEPMLHNGLYSLGFGFATRIVLDNFWRDNFRVQFPDFPEADVPTLPEGFEDVSWHNEAMPHFVNEARGWSLWIDYSDTTKREYQDYKRFQLYRMNDVGDSVESLIESDSWADVLQFISKEGI